MAETQATALEVRDVSKRYGGIEALQNVRLTLYTGEVCALLGENGAGKSTLIKILTGVEPKDQGEILLFGKETDMPDPVAARARGIAAIYQESSLIEHLNVAENIYLGHEPTKALGWKDQKGLVTAAGQHLQHFGIDIDPRTKVRDLGLGQKRIIEILKALTINSRILLLDEPTTGMSQSEIERLFEIMGDLKKHHVTMLYISHHLDEVFQICDRAIVLRDGQNAGAFAVSEIDKAVLIRAMIGKDLEVSTVMPPVTPGVEKKPLLEAVEFRAEGMREPLSFRVAAGEVLGITGIIGAGKTELGNGLFGVTEQRAGELRVNGSSVRLRSPADARKHGIAFIPEDRKKQGLILPHSVESNLTLANLNRVTSGQVFVRPAKRRHAALEIAKRMKVVPLNTRMRARNLSGGNQQKVVIGKWLLGDPAILVMDEPTRGVDVGAKVEIYNLIRALADSGCGIVLFSSEFEEIRRLSDRILVLRQGAIVGELLPEEATGNKLLSLALGG